MTSLADICARKLQIALSSEQPMRRICDAILDDFFSRRPKKLPHEATLHELGLSLHTATVLENFGILNVGALEKCTAGELLEIQFFGPVMLEEVNEKLHAVKRKLRKR